MLHLLDKDGREDGQTYIQIGRQADRQTDIHARIQADVQTYR